MLKPPSKTKTVFLPHENGETINVNCSIILCCFRLIYYAAINAHSTCFFMALISTTVNNSFIFTIIYVKHISGVCFQIIACKDEISGFPVYTSLTPIDTP